jgi:hypothetical protein
MREMRDCAREEAKDYRKLFEEILWGKELLGDDYYSESELRNRIHVVLARNIPIA